MTRWCLSQGIRAGQQIQRAGNFVTLKTADGRTIYSMRVGTECFDSYFEAYLDAKIRRDKKLASLRKQIAKLEAMTFPETSDD